MEQAGVAQYRVWLRGGKRSKRSNHSKHPAYGPGNPVERAYLVMGREEDHKILWSGAGNHPGRGTVRYVSVRLPRSDGRRLMVESEGMAQYRERLRVPARRLRCGTGPASGPGDSNGVAASAVMDRISGGHPWKGVAE